MKLLTALVAQVNKETVKPLDAKIGYSFEVTNADGQKVAVQVRVYLSGMSCWPSLEIIVQPEGTDCPVRFHDNRIEDNEREAIGLALNALSGYEYRTSSRAYDSARDQARKQLAEFL